MGKSISQAEARRYRKRVQQLENMIRAQQTRWARDYPGGTNVATLTLANEYDLLPVVVSTSRKLGHAVVVVADGRVLNFYALPNGGAA